MGDISEMMLDGTRCSVCGVLMIEEGEEECGYPIMCESCSADAEDEPKPKGGPPSRDRIGLPRVVIDKPHACPECGKRFASPQATRCHRRDAHQKVLKHARSA